MFKLGILTGVPVYYKWLNEHTYTNKKHNGTLYKKIRVKNRSGSQNIGWNFWLKLGPNIRNPLSD